MLTNLAARPAEVAPVPPAPTARKTRNRRCRRLRRSRTSHRSRRKTTSPSGSRATSGPKKRPRNWISLAIDRHQLRAVATSSSRPSERSSPQREAAERRFDPQPSIAPESTTTGRPSRPRKEGVPSRASKSRAEQRGGGRRYRAAEEREVEREARPSRLPDHSPALADHRHGWRDCRAGLVAGAGDADPPGVWVPRAAGKGSSKTAAKVGPPPAPPPAEAESSSKNSDRLLRDQGGDKPVRTVGAPQRAPRKLLPPAGNSTEQPPAARPIMTMPVSRRGCRQPRRCAPGERVVLPALPATPAVPRPAVPAPEANGDALVAQKAILYEEPAEGSSNQGGRWSRRSTVTWQYTETGTNGPRDRRQYRRAGAVAEDQARHPQECQFLPSREPYFVEVILDTPAHFGRHEIGAARLVIELEAEELAASRSPGPRRKSRRVLLDRALLLAAGRHQQSRPASRPCLARSADHLQETGQRAIVTFEGRPGDRVVRSRTVGLGRLRLQRVPPAVASCRRARARHVERCVSEGCS